MDKDNVEVDPFDSVKRLARYCAENLTDEQVESLNQAFLYYRRNKPLKDMRAPNTQE